MKVKHYTWKYNLTGGKYDALVNLLNPLSINSLSIGDDELVWSATMPGCFLTVFEEQGTTIMQVSSYVYAIPQYLDSIIKKFDGEYQQPKQPSGINPPPLQAPPTLEAEVNKMLDKI